MPTIKFLPRDVVVEVDSETSVLAAAQKAGVPIATICGGKASCTECKIKIIEGESDMSPIVYKEEEHLGNLFFITKERLACQTYVLGESITVEVLREQIESKAERSRRKAFARSKENAQRYAKRMSDKKQRESEKQTARRRRDSAK